jgi:hypothetical protein
MLSGSGLGCALISRFERADLRIRANILSVAAKDARLDVLPKLSPAADGLIE